MGSTNIHVDGQNCDDNRDDDKTVLSFQKMATVDPAPSIPRRRPRLSPEIIDVDSFDDGEISMMGYRQNQMLRDALDEEGFAYSGYMRPSQRRRLDAGPSSSAGSSSIIILDSDDETSSRDASRERVRRRLVSPPPPHGDSVVIPPVPPVPQHLAGQGSFPAFLRRPLPPPPPPPSIRPNQEPFPFEADIPRHPRRLPTPPVPIIPSAAAARSHHQPVMGLGGALIALNRQNVIAEASRQEADRRRFLPDWVTRSTFFDFLHGFGGAGQNDALIGDQYLMGDDYNYAGGDQIGGGGAEGFNPFGWFDLFGGGLPPRGPPSSMKSDHYKPEYTHPGKPPAGYTYDFAPPEVATISGSSSPTVIVLDDDEPGPSTSNAATSSSSATAVETTLVCARCLDPLVMGSMTDEQAMKARVWVLRCGHILDGKCIEESMRPPMQPVDQAVQPVKGKGKARAGTSLAVDLADASSQDIKGKGKATAGAATEASLAEAVAHDRKGKGKALDVPEPHLPPDYLDNSIRSRLRPRHPPNTSAHAGSTEPPPVVPERPTRPLPRRRVYHPPGPRIKRGRGKARKPVVQEEYEWACPVAGCGCMHLSICVDGMWKMDEQRGAVAAFL